MINNNHFYWLLIAVYSTIHSKIVIDHVSFSVQAYWIFAFFVGICFVISKYLHQDKAVITSSLEVLFWLVQSLVLLLHIQVTFTYWNILFLLLFVLIEIVRFMIGGKIFSLQQAKESYEKEISQYNELFQVVRSERHDFLKHISAVHFMLEKEGSSHAKCYLDELVEGYEETNLSIKGESGSVASVLHRVYKQAVQENIALKYDFDIPLSTLPMKEKDIVGLVGNLLSNSLEASREWQQEYQREAHITIRLSKRSGLYLLTCKNDCLPIPVSILDSLYKKFGKSTKMGKERGYGTRIILDIVKKHCGYLDYTYKEESFFVKIKIPVIKNSNDVYD
ncbi:sensor histidine kinase [Niallia sp. FSL M8-0099]|uniref:sensor histidine kinase n=1 Tax=Niallia sp. FSL M8-0099 TaxID=2954519 RepID=UPI0030FC217C